MLSKKNTVYNNTGYNTRLLSRCYFACSTCTIHNPRSRLYHCTKESVYSAVYVLLQWHDINIKEINAFL